MSRQKTSFALLACLAALWAGDARALKTLVIIENNGGVDPAQRLVSATPYANQSVNRPPKTVTLTFAQPVRSGSIRVYDLYGTQVNNDETTSDGTALSTALPTLPPGRYAVKWRETCQCPSEDLSDEFHFTLRDR